jgi:ribonuclease VapC
MVIDASALVAILLQEGDWRELAQALEAAPRRMVSAATLVETSIVVEARKGPDAATDLDLLIYRSDIEIVPLDSAQAEAARRAWRTFGKGNHPASLNYGDLFSYALAKATGSPLLYKGGDFARTDVTPALANPS